MLSLNINKMCSTDTVDTFIMEITNKIACQSNADLILNRTHRHAFSSCDPDLESMTFNSFILKLDLAILKM